MRVIIAIMLMVGLSGCGTIINSMPDGLLNRLPHWLEPYLESWLDRPKLVDPKTFCAIPGVRPDVYSTGICEDEERRAGAELVKSWPTYADADKKRSCKQANNGNYKTLRCLDPEAAKRINPNFPSDN